MLVLENLSHGFGEKVIYKDVNIRVNKGEKIGLVGANGSGKSTLINILNGTILCDEGRVKWEGNYKVGYLDQYATIDKGKSIYDYLMDAFKDLKELEAETVAYIIGSILDFDDRLLSDSRGYVQGWFKGNRIPDKNATRIMKVANDMLKAGLEK